MPKAAINGTTIYYRIVGNGPWLTLLHGFTGNMHLWDPQLITFASEFTLLRYDMRGHGYSAAPTTGYSLNHYKNDLLGLLEYLGIERTHLWGASLGGSIAIRFALEHPTMVESLILAGSLLEGYPLDSISKLNKERVRRAREDGIERALE